MLLLDNYHVVLPETVVLITACIALLTDLFLKHRMKNGTFFIALCGIAVAGINSFLLLGQYKLIALNGFFISDDTAQLMKLFITVSVFLCFIYARPYLTHRQMPSGEYYILGLFSALGMMVLVSAYSLLIIYLGLELLSLPLYAMTAMRRANNMALEAAMKYFIMGAIASGMLLYGMSLLYGATGNLNLADIAHAVVEQGQAQTMLLSFALVFILAGVGFKLAAVPFHMWAPDVYEGAPTAVTLFISTAPKIAALGMALRLLTLGFVGLASQWQLVILTMALLSTGLGNILAVNQTNIKRLLAYSAIAHIGYALFGVLAVTTAGYAAALYYILVYSLMTMGAFGLIVLLSCQSIEIENIADLRGLNQRSPWLAFMMLIVMFSMAGVPPTVGFFTKLLVLKALVDANMIWIAIVGLFFAIIGAYYYIKVIKVMYFDEADESAPILLSPATKLFYSINCLSLLYFGLFPAGLMNACVSAVS